MTADEIAAVFNITDRATCELLARAAANGRETGHNIARRLERLPEGQRDAALTRMLNGARRRRPAVHSALVRAYGAGWLPEWLRPIHAKPVTPEEAERQRKLTADVQAALGPPRTSKVSARPAAPAPPKPEPPPMTVAALCRLANVPFEPYAHLKLQDAREAIQRDRVRADEALQIDGHRADQIDRPPDPASSPCEARLARLPLPPSLRAAAREAIRAMWERAAEKESGNG